MDEGIVRMQARMYSLVAMMHACEARIEGMKAANKATQFYCGSDPDFVAVFYVESDFVVVQQELEEIAQRLRQEI